jgi:hypothetical protein
MADRVTAGDFAQVLTAVGVIITAVGTYLNGRALRDVKEQTDGMKTELVNEVRSAAFAKGAKSEKDNPT